MLLTILNKIISRVATLWMKTSWIIRIAVNKIPWINNITDCNITASNGMISNVMNSNYRGNVTDYSMGSQDLNPQNWIKHNLVTHKV